MNIKITADSTCDISTDDLRRENIDLFPLGVILGGKEYKDGVDVFPADIIDGVENGKMSCSTSAVSIGEYIEKFEEYLRDYDAVIHISIGESFSSCYRNAVLAAQDMDNVYVVNSKNLSSGQGALVWYAVDMVKQGLDAATIYNRLNAEVDNVRFTFLIDGLDYLRRGGRCSAISAFGANLLGIKPCVESLNGKLEVGKKYRGPMAKCVREYLRDQLKGKESIDSRRVILVYLGIDEAVIRECLDTIESCDHFDSIHCYEAGCTIASHCGPSTIGLYISRK